MKHLRSIAVAATAGTVLLLTGCVVAPPGYPGYQGYNEYGQAVYAQPGPVVVPAPAISIGIGGYYRGGGYNRGYYGGGGRGGYYGHGGWR
ncbi:hypothetical protein BH11PSE13_BH11PSE13_24990 [soil metagenome]